MSFVGHDLEQHKAKTRKKVLDLACQPYPIHTLARLEQSMMLVRLSNHQRAEKVKKVKGIRLKKVPLTQLYTGCNCNTQDVP